MVEVSSTASTRRPATSGPSMRRCRPCAFSLLRTTNASSVRPSAAAACSIAVATGSAPSVRPPTASYSRSAVSVEHHAADERRGGAVEGHAAQVDVVVGLLAAREHDAAVHDGLVEDVLAQLVAIVGVVTSRTGYPAPRCGRWAGDHRQRRPVPAAAGRSAVVRRRGHRRCPARRPAPRGAAAARRRRCPTAARRTTSAPRRAHWVAHLAIGLATGGAVAPLLLVLDGSSGALAPALGLRAEGGSRRAVSGVRAGRRRDAAGRVARRRLARRPGVCSWPRPRPTTSRSTRHGCAGGTSSRSPTPRPARSPKRSPPSPRAEPCQPPAPVGRSGSSTATFRRGPDPCSPSSSCGL